MGIVSDLFGVSQNQITAPPEMISVLPNAAIYAIQRGTLPQINIQTLMLEKGEYCRFVDKACLVTEKTLVTNYKGNRGGFNIRIAKGLSYHTGKSNTTPIREKVPEYTRGYLYITDKRIVFVAKENGFERLVKNVTALTPYSDAIGLQFGEKTFNLLIPTPDIATAALHMVK